MGGHAVAQAVGGQRLAPRREAEVEQRLDLPPVVGGLLLDADHRAPPRPAPGGGRARPYHGAGRGQPPRAAEGAAPRCSTGRARGTACPTTRSPPWWRRAPSAGSPPATREGRDNLAPYSFFNAVAYVPPQVMVASTSAKPDRDGTKDTMANIRETGAFCVNVVSCDLREAMNATSAAPARARWTSSPPRASSARSA